MNKVFEYVRDEISETAGINQENLSNPVEFDGIIEFEWREPKYFNSGQMELLSDDNNMMFGDIEIRDGEMVVEIMYETNNT